MVLLADEDANFEDIIDGETWSSMSPRTLWTALQNERYHGARAMDMNAELREQLDELSKMKAILDEANDIKCDKGMECEVSCEAAVVALTKAMGNATILQRRTEKKLTEVQETCAQEVARARKDTAAKLDAENVTKQALLCKNFDTQLHKSKAQAKKLSELNKTLIKRVKDLQKADAKTEKLDASTQTPAHDDFALDIIKNTKHIMHIKQELVDVKQELDTVKQERDMVKQERDTVQTTLGKVTPQRDKMYKDMPKVVQERNLLAGKLAALEAEMTASNETELAQLRQELSACKQGRVSDLQMLNAHQLLLADYQQQLLSCQQNLLNSKQQVLQVLGQHNALYVSIAHQAQLEQTNCLMMYTQAQNEVLELQQKITRAEKHGDN